MREGDIIIKYNNIMIPPDVDWNKLGQTVITDNFIVELERGGEIVQLKFPKGRFYSVDSELDDYLSHISPKQFVVSGNLYIPRSEARKFKQNFLNGFVTAKVEVKPLTRMLCLVVKALIIDESNDEQYDLFKSRFLDFGHRLTYDSESKVYWLTQIQSVVLISRYDSGSRVLSLTNIQPKELTWHGAAQLAGRLSDIQLKWRLPSLKEFRILYNSSVFPYFNFNREKWFHTSDKLNCRYFPFSDEFYPDGYAKKGGRVLFVTPGTLNTNEYNIYNSSYIELKDKLVFDTKNKLIWLTVPASKGEMTWIEADRFVKTFEYNGLKGWRMPTKTEVDSLYDPTIGSKNKLFNFSHPQTADVKYSDKKAVIVVM